MKPDRRPSAPPDCARCGQPIVGPRAPGAAVVLDEGWVCGFDATAAEHAEYLDRIIKTGGSWK